MNISFVIGVIWKVALVYALFCAILYVSQRSMIYMPDPTRPEPSLFGVPQVKVAEVTTSDGLSISGWYFPPQYGQPVIVFFHGNAQNHAYRVYKTEVLRKAGYGVLLAGYRGYGGNPGDWSEEGFYKDARAYLDWLKEAKDIPAHRIVLYGESLGSGVAVQMAVERDFAGMILETPYTSLVDVARQFYWFMPVGLLMKDRFDNFSKIERAQEPALVLIAADDDIVPAKLGIRLYEALPGPKEIYIAKGATHNNIYARKEAALHVLSFLRNMTDKNKE